MSIKSTYEFISGFKEVVRVDILHDFFKNGALNNFQIVIASQTVRLLKNYGLILKTQNNSILILSEVNDRFNTLSFNGEICLKIQLYPKDKFFLNYTNLPHNLGRSLYFENKFKDNLHPGKFVDKRSIKKSNGKFKFDILLKFNESHGFFGKSSKISKKDILYKIIFTSRSYFLRYNLVTSSNNLGKYYITNEEDEFKLKGFKKRILTSKKTVYSITLKDELKSMESYDFRHFLKKDDDFFKSYLLPLNHPEKQNISYCSSDKVYYADVFINID